MKLRTAGGTLRSKSWRTGKCVLLLLVVSLAAGLSGCAPKRLKVDFTGFERAYAETSNQELLLNLARLENRDPTGELDEQAHPIVQLGYRAKCIASPMKSPCSDLRTNTGTATSFV